MLSVTSSGDGASTLGVYGNTAITLRDAVNALVADPLLVGTDGRRRVTFEKLAETDTVVRLEREITVPAGTRSFEINGLYGLTNGVQIVAGSNARHFDFKGRASDTNGVFSLASLTLKGVNHSWGGGSILLENDAAVSVDACSFLDNHVGINGGAIALTAPKCELYVASTTFAGNSAGGGGAVLVDDGYAFLSTRHSAETRRMVRAAPSA